MYFIQIVQTYCIILTKFGFAVFFPLSLEHHTCLDILSESLSSTPYALLRSSEAAPGPMDMAFCSSPVKRATESNDEECHYDSTMYKYVSYILICSYWKLVSHMEIPKNETLQDNPF